MPDQIVSRLGDKTAIARAEFSIVLEKPLDDFIGLISAAEDVLKSGDDLFGDGAMKKRHEVPWLERKKLEGEDRAEGDERTVKLSIGEQEDVVF